MARKTVVLVIRKKTGLIYRDDVTFRFPELAFSDDGGTRAKLTKMIAEQGATLVDVEITEPVMAEWKKTGSWDKVRSDYAKAKAYDDAWNEGGEGYNPHR